MRVHAVAFIRDFFKEYSEEKDRWHDYKILSYIGYLYSTGFQLFFNFFIICFPFLCMNNNKLPDKYVSYLIFFIHKKNILLSSFE